MTGFFESLTYNNLNPLKFHSVLFFVLFTLFYLFYAFVYKNIRLRNVLLLLFSLYFYYKVSGLFVFILILTATVDYFVGFWIYYLESLWKKRFLLILSLTVNLGYLFYYKYATFLMHIFGVKEIFADTFIDKILFPIGMSFFVFKSLTYIFDIYRKTIDIPEYNYINYLLYVSFFPNILAGPISKARDLLPQLKAKHDITEDEIGRGIFLIMSGAIKKFFIADFLAINFIDRIFDSPSLFGGFENLMAAFGALIQIYCDFSGYTDIVIGLACLMGFTIKPNFNKPFLSQNITEFWRRWHMTLSSWMSDYLFYPLSYFFRRLKMIGVILAVLITFFISGLWHGANWTFVLWGCSHGFAIAFETWTKNLRYKIFGKINQRFYKISSIIITLNFLVFTIILFRASDINKAFEMYKIIFTRFDVSIISNWIHVYFYPLLVLLLGYILHFLPQKLNDNLTLKFISLPWILKSVIFFIVIVIIYQTFSSEALPFVYLEF